MLRDAGIRPSLSISEPGDPYEQEADRIAMNVMRMPSGAAPAITPFRAGIQRKCAPCETGDASCSDCAEEDEEGLEATSPSVGSSPIQRQAADSGGVGRRSDSSAPSVAASVGSLRGGGHPLPEGTRRFFEPRFGVSFGDVRVYTSSEAAELARSLKANAFTVGRDLVFGSGQYTPGTVRGNTLLAHELTHVVQQSRPPGGTHVQRDAVKAVPASANAPKPARTAPQAVSINLDPADAVVFRTASVTLGSINVHFTGRLAINGKGVLIGEELPKKGATAFVEKRLRELVRDAFAAAKLAGSATHVEVPLGGETLVLELAPGAENAPAFQVSGRFVAANRSLAVPGCEVSDAKITLDATAWISPVTPPAPTPQGGQPPLAPGDASARRFAFAGQEAQFGGDARSGTVTLKSNMEAFDSRLPDFVKQHKFLALPEQRAAFFQEMRAYFGTDEKTVAHFARMRKANVKGDTTWLHDEAATRLEQVQAEIGEANMPFSRGVGWPRAECTLAGKQGLGNLHNIGFAVDYNAYQTPHIQDQRTLDLIQIVTGRSPSLSYGAPAGMDTRAVGETYTHGSDADKARLDADQKVQNWLVNVAKEAAAMGKASDDFRASLKAKDAAGAEVDLAPKLQELRQNWFAAKEKVAAARLNERKAKKADKDKAKEETKAAEAEQQAVQDELQVVLKPWLDKVGAQKTAMETKIKAVGLDPGALPTGKKLETAVAAAQLLDKRMATLAGKLGAELKKGQRAQVDRLIAEARKLLDESGAAPADDAAAVAEFKRLADLVDKRQTALIQKKWLDRVNTLHTALTDAPSFVFGTGSAKAAKYPALAQLVDIGFFNLRGQAKAGTGAFGPDFVKSMIKHGFTHGGTWSTPDFMHFELRWAGPE